MIALQSTQPITLSGDLPSQMLVITIQRLARALQAQEVFGAVQQETIEAQASAIAALTLRVEALEAEI